MLHRSQSHANNAMQDTRRDTFQRLARNAVRVAGGAIALGTISIALSGCINQSALEQKNQATINQDCQNPAFVKAYQQECAPPTTLSVTAVANQKVTAFRSDFVETAIVVVAGVIVVGTLADLAGKKRKGEEVDTPMELPRQLTREEESEIEEHHRDHTQTPPSF